MVQGVREERRQRSDKAGVAGFGVEAAERSGKKVVELDQVSKRFGDKVVINHFSSLIKRGDRIGIVGANGAGKSTLMNIIGCLDRASRGEYRPFWPIKDETSRIFHVRASDPCRILNSYVLFLLDDRDARSSGQRIERQP